MMYFKCWLDKHKERVFISICQPGDRPVHFIVSAVEMEFAGAVMVFL